MKVDTTLVIYPYTYIAQLQIETTSGKAISYDGKYDRDITLHPPKIDSRESEPLTNAAGTPVMQKAMMDERVKQMKDIIREFEEREQQRMLKKPNHSKRKLIIIKIILGTLSILSIGVSANLLSNPEPNFWRNIACGLILVIGVISFGTLTALSYFYDESKWGGLD